MWTVLRRNIRKVVFEEGNSRASSSRITKSMMINAGGFAVFMMIRGTWDLITIGVGSFLGGWTLLDRFMYNRLDRLFVSKIEVEDTTMIFTRKKDVIEVEQDSFEVVNDSLPLVECKTSNGEVFYVSLYGKWLDEDFITKFKKKKEE